MLSKISRLLRTIKYLKFIQFCFFIKRRFFPLTQVKSIDFQLKKNQLNLLSPIAYGESKAGYRFTFLNETYSFPNGDIDWVSSDKKRLWVYNLHYFDYLRGEKTFDEKLCLIKHWISHNPQNKTPGWEPFTCSLRIVNWIFFIIQYEIEDEEILNSLYIQALWLEKNDEKHILANHYFENLKALLFTSYFFEGDDADRWFNYASKNLAKQIDEQFLSDGGHYERTPQYHGLMLENLLDLYNLIKNNTSFRVYDKQERLVMTLSKALDFHKSILMPDDTLPMFNDTAQGISPSVDELSTYACQLSLANEESVDGLIDYPDSGLFGYKNSQDMLIVDAGDIGPSYQPGHTHCDMLSYELYVAGYPIVVDTGVYEYQPGDLRKYVRSTKAHNTLQIGSHEQSEVWGEFRVGERAKVVAASIQKQGDSVSFSGEINAFRLLSKSIYHKRTAELKLSNEGHAFKLLTIEDSIFGDQTVFDGIKAFSYVHFHPEVLVSQLSDFEVAISKDDLELLLTVNSNDVTLTLEKCAYCPEFGVLKDSVCLVLSKNATMFDNINYTIKRV